MTAQSALVVQEKGESKSEISIKIEIPLSKIERKMTKMTKMTKMVKMVKEKQDDQDDQDDQDGND